MSEQAQSFQLEIATNTEQCTPNAAGYYLVKLELTCRLYRALVNDLTVSASPGAHGKTAHVIGFKPREMLHNEVRTFTVAVPEDVHEIGVLVHAGSTSISGKPNYFFFWRSQTISLKDV